MTLYPSKLLSAGLLSLAVLFSTSANAATITITPAGPYIVGQPITFTSSAGAAALENNNWDFGDRNTQYNKLNGQSNANYGLKKGSTDNLATIIHKFGSEGKYIVTLASQENFPDAISLKALTTTSFTEIAIGPCAPNCEVVAIIKPAKLYLDNCSNCHGVVNALGTVDKGEHSILAGRIIDPVIDPARLVQTIGLQITATLITDAYANNPKYMRKANGMGAGVYFLQGQEAINMAAYINTLVVNVNVDGDSNLKPFELYKATCSRCHGTGTGGYARNIIGASAVEIRAAISPAIPDMAKLDLTAIDVQNISDFLSGKVQPPGQPENAPLITPLTGLGLNEMYCSYCHGLDGTGGAYVTESILGDGMTGESILREINKSKNADPDEDNMMSVLQKQMFTLDQMQLIADVLQ